jgi:hypothetical protein
MYVNALELLVGLITFSLRSLKSLVDESFPHFLFM